MHTDDFTRKHHDTPRRRRVKQRALRDAAAVRCWDRVSALPSPLVVILVAIVLSLVASVCLGDSAAAAERRTAFRTEVLHAHYAV